MRGPGTALVRQPPVICATLIVGLAAFGVSAVELSVGNIINAPRDLADIEDMESGKVITYVDVTKPSNATGLLQRVEFPWGGCCCALAADVSLYRRRGNSFRAVWHQAVDITGFDNEISFSNPPPIEQGDYIALSMAGKAFCGSPEGENSIVYGDNILALDGLPDEFDLADARVIEKEILGIHGAGTATKQRIGVIPVIATAPGANGASFRTSFRMQNALCAPDFTPDFHLQMKDVPGDSPDTEFSYTLKSGGKVQWDDLMHILGFQSGQEVGAASVDVFAPPGTPLPLFETKMREIRGGTSCVIPIVDTTSPPKYGSPILTANTSGYVLIPSDLAYYDKKRMNIGIRSLDEEVEGRFENIYHTDDPQGGPVFTLPPRTLIQKDWKEFSPTIYPDDFFRVVIYRGSAIVYQSVIDNETNDATFTLILSNGPRQYPSSECPSGS